MSRKADVEHSLKVFKHLSSRAILPLVSHPESKLAADVSLPDLSNVQGDVIYLFPKRAENFVFFRISNVPAFRTALKSFKPTTSADVRDHLAAISDAKEAARTSGADKMVDLAQYQMAFTRMGMNFLGVKENTGDVRFDNRCMRDDKSFLGDGRDWDAIFNKESYDPVNGSVKNDKGALHGVITIAAHDPEKCKEATDGVLKLFGPSITVAGGAAVEGRARTGDYKGHEHFGFKDGISQPGPRGLVVPHPGQIQVDPGVLLMGYPGDPVLDDPSIKVKRPSWTKDGTILVFRKLEQSVLLFEDYVTKNGKRWREFIPGGPAGHDLSDGEGADLFGARLIGRWKSGAPLARCPFKDDKVMAEDAERNNDFDYVVRDNPKVSANEPSDYYCPFTIHTRKTAPRNLDPFLNRKYLESGSIVRGGLPYGDEVSQQERDAYKLNDPEKPRGLLFNCYMTSLDSGFIRQTGFAGNDFFPLTSLVPKKLGQDPILGSPETPTNANVSGDLSVADGGQVNLRINGKDGKQIEVSGFAKVTDTGARPPPGEPNPFFVTSRGGEYFFVPSVSTLKTWANDTGSGGPLLDILFLLDATGSMQTYIDQVRNNVQQMCDTLVATGKWARRDLRFGFITFRDHPPEEETYVTRVYPFDSDTGAIKSNLEKVKAEGGGDGPEAQCDALYGALTADWKLGATRVAVLITDSPPHGIKEEDDGFPKGCPDQHDPIRSAKRMAALGITLHVLACEPTLSIEYSTPLDFYTHLAERTGGKLFGLADVQALTNLITGSVLESADIDALADKHAADIRAGNGNIDQLSRDLHSRLSSAGVKLNTFDAEHIYEPNKDGDHNVQIWHQAESTDDPVVSQIKEINDFRLKPAYRSGGVQPMSLKVQPVSLDQVKRVVKKSLARSE